jgi:hypothetical protein
MYYIILNMDKIHTIFYLFLFIVILFSINMYFGNPLKETFSGLPTHTDLQELSKLQEQPNNFDGKSDDQPLHVSFPYKR